MKTDSALARIAEVKDVLAFEGIEHPRKEAEEIVAHVLQIDRTGIYRDDPPVSGEQKKTIDVLIRRRASRELLQYILGYAEFQGLRIQVGQGVLIPRPETELMVDKAIRVFSHKHEKEEKLCQEQKTLNILDLCTGSGCVALALARRFPRSKVYGTDISDVALRYALKNAELYGKGNARFLRGSLYDPVEGLRFGLVVSNPPYIKTGEIEGLQQEISAWEPHGALDGGPDGLDYFRAIIGNAGKYLCSNGYLVLEIGIGQNGAVNDMIEAAGLRSVSIHKDLSGIKRVFIAGQDS